MIYLLAVFYRKINENLIIIEFYLQILLPLNNVRNLQTYLGWSLIPRIGKFSTKQLLLNDIFFA